jgi:hypothetical protein
LTPDSRSAALTLPWPKDAHGIAAKEIGWYRIAYKIEADGAPESHGVLSVGAIASNLLALRLARPGILISGKPLSLRVFAGNPITRAPYRGVRLQATLVFEPTDSETDSKAAKSTLAKRTLVRVATTGASGEALFNFPIKTEPGQEVNLTLTVTGTMTGLRGAGARPGNH